MTFLRRCGVTLTALFLILNARNANAEAIFAPTPEMTLSDLSQAIRQRSPAVLAEQLNVDLAEAEEQQSRLWGNPELDLGWGTIPIGPSNPPDLRHPMLHIPSYSVGVSYTFLVGKRGPRIKRAQALKEAAVAGHEAATLEQTLVLAKVLGQMATSKLRQEGQKGLIEQEKGSLAVARSRLDAGQGTPLDVDRLEIELGRMEQQTLGVEGDERAALASCSALVGGSCVSFANESDARAFLQRWIDQASKLMGDIERRADLRALEAQRRAAEREGELAKASSKPDFTLRFGYTYDTFVASGSQNHSLSLQLAFPIPLFDQGQAWYAATSARKSRLETIRKRTIDAELARVEPLRRTLDVHRQRQIAISTRLLPKARAVLSDLDRVTSSRLLSVTEAIQAHRTINELLIEEANSFSDAYQAALDLFSVLPPSSEMTSR